MHEFHGNTVFMEGATRWSDTEKGFYFAESAWIPVGRIWQVQAQSRPGGLRMAQKRGNAVLTQCGRCEVPKAEKFCRAEKGKGPASCPSLHKRELVKASRENTPPEEVVFARQAAIQESVGYRNRDKGYGHVTPEKPRIVEIVEFAKRMGYKHLGLIFCGGAQREGEIVHEILETNGFTVTSVMCKAGKVPKSSYGVTQEQHVDQTKPVETVCNPKFQALVVNEVGVDFNILVNLCVGHDSIALMHLEAPTTVLSVKDRVTGHSPLVPIYQYDSYYRYLKYPLPLDDL